MTPRPPLQPSALPGGVQPDLLSWMAETLPAGALVSGVGVSAFVVAILTDRLMTKGQHERRVADLLAYQQRELDEMRESRDYYRAARIEERERANRATDQLGSLAEYAKLTNHLLGSVTSMAKGEQ